MDLTDAVVGAAAQISLEFTGKTLYRLGRDLVQAHELAVDAELKRQQDEDAKANAERTATTLADVSAWVKAQHVWESIPEDEQPDGPDFANAVNDFREAYERSDDAKHRKLLFAAFKQTFNPKFYTKGRHKDLWEYATQLNYPDAVFLRQVFEGVTEQLQRVKAALRDQVAGSEKVRRARAFQISKDDVAYDSARRLTNLGLVTLLERPDDMVAVRPYYGLVEELIEFIWETTYNGGDPENKAETQPAS